VSDTLQKGVKIGKPVRADHWAICELTQLGGQNGPTAEPTRAETVHGQDSATRSKSHGLSAKGEFLLRETFRGQAVIFLTLGLILYSDHDLIPCMTSARLTRAVPMLQEELHDTASL
jgi:hypothetical protein